MIGVARNVGMRVSSVLLWLCSVFVMVATAAFAQSERDILRVPWAPLPGVYELVDGELTGFFAEMTNEVARRAGFDVEYIRFPDHPSVLAALADGEGDLLSGVVRLPILDGRVVYSEPFANTAVYLFVRTEAPPDVGPDNFSGRRIAVFRNTAGADIASFGGQATVEAFDTMEGGFGALLVGRVDGVVALHKVGADFLQRSRLDYRVRTAGPPISEHPHYVAVSPRYAALIPAIDAALAEMRADGSLDSILRRWNMVPPVPEPNVLTVGVTHFPPYQIVRPDGEFTGYSVESLRALALRAGLDLTYREITVEEWAVGPETGTFDLLPPLSVTDAKKLRMDFTIPLQQSPYSIFLRSDREAEVSELKDLRGLTVGAIDHNLAVELAEDAGLTVTPYAVPADLIDALLDGAVDAVLYHSVTTRALFEDRGVLGEIREVFPPFVTSERAVALRFGLPNVRERLNVVIPGYLSSEEYQALRERWLGEPDFWTPWRIRVAQGLGLGLVIFIALAFLTQSRRGQRIAMEQAEDMRRASMRLHAILDTTRAAIIGLQRDGTIAIANPGARSMLKLPDGPWPMPWPNDIVFIDADTREPLMSSANPLERAKAGASIVSERAVVCTGEDQSFVRVSSSSVEATRESDVATVFVIEDVTEQERTRQQVERAGRLDALGQLTGGVAHDFNNILGTIQYATQLASKSADAKQRKYLDAAISSVSRGEELTSRLLSFAKRQPSNRASVRVSEVLGDLRSLAEPLLERSISLSIVLPEAGLCVVCDVSQLENALLNLVINSRDAILLSAASGTIIVQSQRLEEPDTRGNGRVRISVIDDGPGMTSEVQRRATDPFFTTKPKDKGSGLGLSMAYGFAEQSDGDLTIETKLGGGTAIHLDLPQGEIQNDLDGTGSSTRRVGNGETVLIVEDEHDLLEMTAEIVRDMGYVALTAPSGRAAIDMLDREKCVFDVLLTDVVMPEGIGGFELARLVRERRKSVPVVYMSGYTGFTHESMGGVVGPVLRKPCSSVELSRVLRRALSPA